MLTTTQAISDLKETPQDTENFNKIQAAVKNNEVSK